MILDADYWHVLLVRIYSIVSNSNSKAKVVCQRSRSLKETTATTLASTTCVANVCTARGLLRMGLNCYWECWERSLWATDRDGAFLSSFLGSSKNGPGFSGLGLYPFLLDQRICARLAPIGLALDVRSVINGTGKRIVWAWPAWSLRGSTGLTKGRGLLISITRTDFQTLDQRRVCAFVPVIFVLDSCVFYVRMFYMDPRGLI